MSPYVSNLLLVTFLAWVVLLLDMALLWRTGLAGMRQSTIFNEIDGLAIGAKPLEIAATAHGQEYHLSFEDSGGPPTLLVFGKSDCGPCGPVLESAALHPLARRYRMVYVADTVEVDAAPELVSQWELYELVSNVETRKKWRAAVAPYAYMIHGGRIVAKGIVNGTSHLDTMLDAAFRNSRDGLPKPTALAMAVQTKDRELN